jgi:hypothetical protein
VDNIKLDLGEIEWGDMGYCDRKHVNQRRALVNKVMNFRFPYNAGKFLSSYTKCGLSKRSSMELI